jgi:hypothetical protein
MTPAPLIFNFHVVAHTHPYNPVYVWGVYLCSIVASIFAAKSFRSVFSGSCSLSLSNIGCVPVLLGILAQILAAFTISIVLALSSIFSGGTHRPSLNVIGCADVIGTVAGFGLAGMIAWRTASRNKCGHVIFTALLFIVLALSYFLFRLIKSQHPNVVLFFAHQLLTLSMFILGARLAQKLTAPNASTP